MRSRRSLTPTLRALLFVGLFLAGTGLHFVTRPWVAPFVNHTLNAVVAAQVINLATPAAQVQVQGSLVGAGAVFVKVAQGCEGIDMVVMLLAAIAVFPATRRRKLLGAVAGTLFIYWLNVLRIAGLWYSLRYWPSAFEVAHSIVGQTVMILAGVMFFGLWTRASLGLLGGRPGPTSAVPA